MTPTIDPLHLPQPFANLTANVPDRERRESDLHSRVQVEQVPPFCAEDRRLARLSELGATDPSGLFTGTSVPLTPPDKACWQKIVRMLSDPIEWTFSSLEVTARFSLLEYFQFISCVTDIQSIELIGSYLRTSLSIEWVEKNLENHAIPLLSFMSSIEREQFLNGDHGIPNDIDFRITFRTDHPKNLNQFFRQTINFIAEKSNKHPPHLSDLIRDDGGLIKKSRTENTSLISIPGVDVMAMLPKALNRYYGRSYDESLILPLTSFIQNGTLPGIIYGSIQALIDWIIKRRREIQNGPYDYSDGLKAVSKMLQGWIPCSLNTKKEWVSALFTSSLFEKIGCIEGLFATVESFIHEHHRDCKDATVLFWLQFVIIYRRLIDESILTEVEGRILQKTQDRPLAETTRNLHEALMCHSHKTVETSLFLLGWSILNADGKKISAKLRTNQEGGLVQLNFLDSGLFLFVPYTFNASLNDFSTQEFPRSCSIVRLYRSFQQELQSRQEPDSPITDTLNEKRAETVNKLQSMIESSTASSKVLPAILLSNLHIANGRIYDECLYQLMTEVPSFVKMIGEHFLESEVYSYLKSKLRSNSFDKKWVLSLCLSNDPKVLAFSFQLWKNRFFFIGGEFLRTYFRLMLKKDLQKGIILFTEILKKIRVDKQNQADFLFLLKFMDKQRFLPRTHLLIGKDRIFAFLEKTLWKQLKTRDFLRLLACANSLREGGHEEVAGRILSNIQLKCESIEYRISIIFTLFALFERNCADLSLLKALWAKLDHHAISTENDLSMIEFHLFWLEIEENPQHDFTAEKKWIDHEKAFQLEVKRSIFYLENERMIECSNQLIELLEDCIHIRELSGFTQVVTEFLDRFLDSDTRGAAQCSAILLHPNYHKLEIAERENEKKCLIKMVQNRSLRLDCRFVQLLDRVSSDRGFILTLIHELFASPITMENCPDQIKGKLEELKEHVVQGEIDKDEPSQLTGILALYHSLGIPLRFTPALLAQILEKLTHENHPSSLPYLMELAEHAAAALSHSNPFVQPFFSYALYTLDQCGKNDPTLAVLKNYLSMKGEKKLVGLRALFPQIPSFFSQRNVNSICTLHHISSQSTGSSFEQEELDRLFYEQVQSFHPKAKIKFSLPLLQSVVNLSPKNSRKKHFRSLVKSVQSDSDFQKVVSLLLHFQNYSFELWGPLFSYKRAGTKDEKKAVIKKLIHRVGSPRSETSQISSLLYSLFSSPHILPAECHLELVSSKTALQSIGKISLKKSRLVRFFFSLIPPVYPHFTKITKEEDLHEALCCFYKSFFTGIKELYPAHPSLFFECYVKCLIDHIRFFINQKHSFSIKYALSYYILLFHILCKQEKEDQSEILFKVFNSVINEIEINESWDRSMLDRDFYHVKLDEFRIPLDATPPRVLEGFQKLTEEVIWVILSLPHEEFQRFFRYILFVFTASLQQNLPPSLLLTFSKKFENEQVPNFIFKKLDLLLAVLISLTVRKGSKNLYRKLSKEIEDVIDNMEEHMIETTWTVLHHPALEVHPIFSGKERAKLLLKWHHFLINFLNQSPFWSVFEKFQEIPKDIPYSDYYIKVRDLFENLNQDSILRKSFEAHLQSTRSVSRPGHFFENFFLSWIQNWLVKASECYREDSFSIVFYYREFLDLIIETDISVVRLLSMTFSGPFPPEFIQILFMNFFGTALDYKDSYKIPYIHEKLSSSITSLTGISSMDKIQGRNRREFLSFLHGKLVDCLIKKPQRLAHLLFDLNDLNIELLRLDIPFSKKIPGIFSRQTSSKDGLNLYALSLIHCESISSDLSEEEKFDICQRVLLKIKAVWNLRTRETICYILKELSICKNAFKRDQVINYLLNLGKEILKKRSSIFDFPFLLKECEEAFENYPSLNWKEIYGVLIHEQIQRLRKNSSCQEAVGDYPLLLLQKFKKVIKKKEYPLYYTFLTDLMEAGQPGRFPSIKEAVMKEDALVIKYCLSLYKKKCLENRSLKSQKKGWLLLQCCRHFEIFDEDDDEIKKFAETFEKTL